MAGISTVGRVARVGLFALLPAVATAGAMATAVVLGIAGGASFKPSRVQQFVERHGLVLGALAAWAAWTIASIIWSPVSDHRQALRFAAVCVTGVLFVIGANADAAEKRWTRSATLAAFVLMAGMLGVEAAWADPLNHAANPAQSTDWLDRNTGRGTVVLLALAWPAGAALLARGEPARALAACTAIAAAGILSAQFGQTANLVAFACGLIAFACAWLLPRLATGAAFAGAGFWILAAPFATPLLLTNQRLVDSMPYSWAARAGIWRYVCARIAERPLLGHGLDASRTVTDHIVVNGLTIRAIELHPHSASLQIWFETGAIGAVLAAAVLAAIAWSIVHDASLGRAKAAAVCATLATLTVIANVSYGAWQEWWDATIFIAATAAAAISAKTGD